MQCTPHCQLKIEDTKITVYYCMYCQQFTMCVRNREPLELNGTIVHCTVRVHTRTLINKKLEASTRLICTVCTVTLQMRINTKLDYVRVQ